MKQPIEHGASANEYEPLYCVEDGQPWPCKTWRRWIKSKDYRIAELEATVKHLADQSARHDARQRDLERTVREDSNILRNGIFRAVSDVGRHNRMGNLTLDWVRDYVDVSPAFDSHRVRDALPAELTVTYEDIGGRTWTNGEITEQTYPPDGEG